MSLTDTAIRKAKPATKPYKLTDGGGLYLLIQPNGAKWWRLDYRRPVTKVRTTLSLGTYPEVTLAKARARQAEAREQLADGIDPGEARKAAKASGKERAANSFEVVAREYMARQTWVPNHASKVLAWMENDVFPWIGGKPIAGLTAPDFLAVARRVEERGAVESAHRILQNCGAVMRYAIATGRATHNPVPDLRGALRSPEGKNHAAITNPSQLGGLLRSMEGYEGTFTARCALRLTPLVFLRPGELRQAEWAEIDLEAAEWTIPAAKMKMRVAHTVPLSEQAIAILREIQPLTGEGRYVFPSVRDPNRPLSENTVRSALRNLGYDNETQTPHGFRATARTLLDEVLGFRPDYIEHQLAHEVKDPNGRAYNRTAHLPERRKMMQAWADYLDALRADTGGVVVPFKTKAA